MISFVEGEKKQIGIIDFNTLQKLQGQVLKFQDKLIIDSYQRHQDYNLIRQTRVSST